MDNSWKRLWLRNLSILFVLWCLATTWARWVLIQFGYTATYVLPAVDQLNVHYYVCTAKMRQLCWLWRSESGILCLLVNCYFTACQHASTNTVMRLMILLYSIVSVFCEWSDFAIMPNLYSLSTHQTVWFNTATACQHSYAAHVIPVAILFRALFHWSEDIQSLRSYIAIRSN